MLQQMFEPAAIYWLGQGEKYRASAKASGANWTIPVQDAIRKYGLTLDNAKTLQQATDVFRGRWHWRPDPLFQIWDSVDPPAILLAHSGEDCDGWAMTHAQAAQYVMGKQWWNAYIVSYYADPWNLSHHFAVAVDPTNTQYWVIQPQPAADQAASMQIVFGPYRSFKETADLVAASYNAKVVWYDVRTPMWEPTGKQ